MPLALFNPCQPCCGPGGPPPNPPHCCFDFPALMYATIGNVVAGSNAALAACLSGTVVPLYHVFGASFSSNDISLCNYAFRMNATCVGGSTWQFETVLTPFNATGTAAAAATVNWRCDPFALDALGTTLADGTSFDATVRAHDGPACCPGTPPETLYAAVQNVESPGGIFGEMDAACYAGVAIPLSWNAGLGKYLGSDSTCFPPIILSLSCRTTFWFLEYSLQNSLFYANSFDYSCSPVDIRFADLVSGYAAAFDIVVTE